METKWVEDLIAGTERKIIIILNTESYLTVKHIHKEQSDHYWRLTAMDIDEA